ncbi:tyrosine-type recombinase/integrase [Vibrio parahaemolyticus]|nr:tyrosine-type recombinase/integrase [Vibrio parahaemolyticus]EJC7056095.1 tyrosine-type recombinase/integrase [Vibrio parahaemolyticus]EJC7057042.1 tyrosine-type recombinase/integrase [Vibrio parahaemolyticus]EJC7099505.1 tyrosine-type recombinase/integrase [Vibrio parahaemolyticus]EJC7113255.1 tyrosine-type recombinase/integrase [Vibrio parahaemolyticus]
MPKVARNLTFAEIKNYKPKAKEQLLSDGGGLTVRVRPNGTKTFYFQYTHQITRRKVKLLIGPFPEISLLQARKQALEFRELLARGNDPRDFVEQQREAKLLAETDLLIETAAEWFEVKKHSISEDYADDIWRSLELHIFPSLGKVPVSKISAPRVIKILRCIETKGNLETVKRLNQRLNEIMTYAVNTGKIYVNPIQNIKAAFKKPKPQNMKSIPPSELPQLIKDISSASLKMTTRCLIEFQLHTMARPAEASNALWSEIDWENHLWILPAKKMKMGRQHVIPLSEYCIELLKKLKYLDIYNTYIFSSPSNGQKPLNSQTVNAALKRMGYGGKLVSHGFRSVASTVLNEQGFDRDVIETALAHVDKNQVRSAYNKAIYIDQRRAMMNWWSNYIIKMSLGSRSIVSKRVRRPSSKG